MAAQICETCKHKTERCYCAPNSTCKWYEEEVLTEKEKLSRYITNPTVTDAKNSMGCSENWYNAYYAIKETFSFEEIQSMTDKEIENLVRLADEIGMALY